MKTINRRIIPSMLLFFVVALTSTNVNAQSSVTFNCTGAAQNWVVPPCVFSINVIVEGAEGGGPQGGDGAVVTATLAVTPGQTLQINVGCVGACSGTGFNGGGSGPNATGAGNGACGGGGASDIRVTPFGLANRIVVAGGGGGTGGGDTDGTGGNGGCAAGTAGASPFGVGGQGGSATAGGTGGPPWGGGATGSVGTLGLGGNGAADPCYNKGPGGGGGGGYYGGGGGGSDCYNSPPLGGGGGGGGSSLTPAGGTCTAAGNTGPGVVTINYGVGGGATTASNTGPYCAGQTIQLNAGAGGLAYAWTGPLGYTSATQNPTIPASTVAMSGTYTVSITFAGGCTATATTAVVVNPVPVTTVNSPTACNGATATLTAAGATTYAWSTGAVTNPISVTPAATTSYTVTGTSAGCTSTAVSTVTVIPTPAPVPTNSGPVCSGSTLNLFCPAVAGATYSWTGPAGFTSTLQNPSVPAVTAANGGIYSVTYTLSGCTSPVGTTNVTVLNTPAPPILTNNGPLCAGQNLILTANNIAGATYAWTGPSGFTAAVRNPPPFASSVASAGTYTCTVTVGGCVSAPATTTVVVNAMPVAPTCPNMNACFGTSATLTASVSGPVYEWWDAASGGTMLGTGSTYTTPPLTSTTTYYVQSNNVGCIGPMTAVTVTVTMAFTVNAGLDDSICAGASSTLNVVSPTGGGYTYTWMPGGMSGPTQTVTPASSTTYTVTVVDAIGCTGSDSVSVYVGTPVTATASGVAETCAGACNGTASVVAAGGFGPLNYNWTPGNPTGDGTANITALCNGTYTIVVTDVIGCSATDNTTITGPPAMGLVTGFTNATCNAMCDGTATVTAAGGTLPYNYVWSSGQTTPGVTGLCAGNYTVTVTDAMGCIATATFTITQPAPVAVDALPPVTICIGQSTTLVGSGMGGTSPYTFDWSAPAFTGPTYTVSPVVTTTYTVSATDAAGCPSINTQTVTVTVRPPLSVNASNNVSICPGGNTTISAVGAGGDNTYTYTWMPGGMTGSSQNVSPAVTTTYTVVLTDGCTTLPAADSVTVTVLPLPTVMFNSNLLSGCTPLPVNFTDLTTVVGGNIASWNWNFGTAGTADVPNPTVVFSNAGVYTVTLTVTTDSGCVNSFTINNMITVNALPVASFIYDPQPTTIATPTINFHDMSTDATGWYWNFGDSITGANNFSNMMNPSHAYSDTGSYCVTLIVTNTGSCADTITDCNLYISPEYSFWVPNSFTPDGDGLNDIFMAKGEHIDEFSMRIFDRWGELAFYSDDIYKGWNGAKMNTGEVAQQDVFVYIIQVKDKLGMNHQYIGHVTIIK